MNSNEGNSPFLTLLFLINILVAINFWSFQGYVTTYAVTCSLFMMSSIVIVLHRTKIQRTSLTMIVSYTLFTVFLAIIPAYIDYGQPIFNTLKPIMDLMYGLLLYYILKIGHFSTQKIIHILSLIGLVWVFLEIFQQFTYPDYWFAGRLEDQHGELENRMGLWRFYIWGVDFVLIIMAFWLSKLFTEEKISSRTIIWSVIFVIGILCYGSRKHIAIAFLSIGYLLFSSNKKTKKILFLFTGLIVVFLVSAFMQEFMELNSDMNDRQGTGEDFIRVLEAIYFLFDFSDSPLYPILGSGMRDDSSALFWAIESAHDMGLYQSDCGIIGYYSMFGIVGVSAIFAYIIYFIKNRKYIDTWLKIFFMIKIILIFFDFWAIWAVGYAAYGVFLYMLDENIQKNKNLQLTESI